MTKVKISAEQEKILKRALTNKMKTSNIVSLAVAYHIEKDYNPKFSSDIQSAVKILDSFSTTDIVRIFLGEYEVEETAMEKLQRKYKTSKLGRSEVYLQGVEDTLAAFNLSLKEENNE